MKTGWASFLLFVPLVMLSCVQPIRNLATDEAFLRQEAGKKPWRKVAVLPFAGDPAFRRGAGEWFAYRVRKLGIFEVTGPSLARIELGKRGVRIDENAIASDKARRSGISLGVDGVVFGSIMEGPTTAPGAPEVGINLLDTATGKVVASSTRSNRRASSHDQGGIVDAVDRIAEDFSPVLFALAGRHRPSPAKAEGGNREPPETR